MKKLLMGSAALLLFSCAIIIFQISCKKEAMAQRPAGNGTNKILYNKAPIGQFDGAYELWISDYDGSNAVQIPLVVPGWQVNNPQLSPDGTKIFFSAFDSSRLGTTYVIEIFSADVDGSNVQQITHDNAAGKSAGIYMVN